MKKIYFIIPIFNEGKNLPTLFLNLINMEKKIKTFNLNFILVDDGSTDNSISTANENKKNLNLKILKHKINLGPGAAFSSAFLYLNKKLNKDDIIVTIEGDNTSNLDMIPKMLNRLKEGYDVVLASPYIYGGGFSNTSFFRRILSMGANLIFKDILLNMNGIFTISCFFRMYKGEVIQNLQKVFGKRIIDVNGYEGMVELLMKIMILKTSISEIAMIVDSSKNLDKSKMKISKTILGYLSLYKKKFEWFKQYKKIYL